MTYHKKIFKNCGENSTLTDFYSHLMMFYLVYLFTGLHGAVHTQL